MTTASTRFDGRDPAHDSAPLRETFECSVVVPYFQRERGILARAVTSALAQQGVPTPRVIVIDDGSPINAEDELRDLLERHPRHLVVLRQKNAGPAAARNHGIKYARRDSHYIAFLDSDDVWEPTHLAMAMRALEAGFDFYFSNAILRDGATTIFVLRAFPSETCRPIDTEAGIFAYGGDLLERILTGCPILTPAVVYRTSTIPLTFRTDLRTAGEDHYFWLEVAGRTKKIAFGTTPTVRLGYGVNISLSPEWGSPERLLQIYYNQTYTIDARKRLSASVSQERAFRAQERLHQRQFIDNMISGLLSSRKSEVLAVTIKFLRKDPSAALQIPAIALRRVRGRLRKEAAKRPARADS
jgi:succinoglycan biosynthesis protein ExoW